MTRKLKSPLEKKVDANTVIERRINLDKKKLEGLPDELLAQLSHSLKKKPTKVSILIEILKESKAHMNIDDLLIAYYKKTGVILKRIGVAGAFVDAVHRGVVLKVGGYAR